MECPFCAETIKDEALACKHCSRDLRIARPAMLEIQEIVLELDKLRRDLDHVNSKLQRVRDPVRYLVTHVIGYVLVPVILLVAAHIFVTITLNVSPLYLRLASVIIPLPFGLVLLTRQKIGLWGAAPGSHPDGVTLAVTCMLVVTGVNDQRSDRMPESRIEWLEVIEYTASIALAFVTGNILAYLIFYVLPKTMAHGGKPNVVAYKIANAY